MIRGNKYGAKKAKGYTTGKLYDSQAERDRAEYLVKSQGDGEIADFCEQPKVAMTKYQSYKPDFAYLEKGRWVFEDVKGVETDRFKINVKLWRERGPGVLRISKRLGTRGTWQYRDLYPDTIDITMWDGYTQLNKELGNG